MMSIELAATIRQAFVFSERFACSLCVEANDASHSPTAIVG